VRHWLDAAANPRLHATTQRVVNGPSPRKSHTQILTLAPFAGSSSWNDGWCVGGNLYSVPDATRKRVVEVHTLADEGRIFEDGTRIAAYSVLEC